MFCFLTDLRYMYYVCLFSSLKSCIKITLIKMNILYDIDLFKTNGKVSRNDARHMDLFECHPHIIRLQKHIRIFEVGNLPTTFTCKPQIYSFYYLPNQIKLHTKENRREDQARVSYYVTIPLFYASINHQI